MSDIQNFILILLWCALWGGLFLWDALRRGERDTI
jgi:hypothetical protein